MKWTLAILGALLVGVAATLIWVDCINTRTVMVGNCLAPRSVNIASAIQLGLSWKKQEAVVGGNLDPEVVGKDLPKEFVTEEGRTFALCLFNEQRPEASQRERLCYSLFLAAAAEPDKLVSFKQECFSASRVSHVGKLENIIFNMVQSPTEDHITLRAGFKSS